MTAAKREGRLAPHPQVSGETPAGGDKFSAVQEAADFSVSDGLLYGYWNRYRLSLASSFG
jgi:hypothetical protein